MPEGSGENAVHPGFRRKGDHHSVFCKEIRHIERKMLKAVVPLQETFGLHFVLLELQAAGAVEQDPARLDQIGSARKQ